GEARADRLEVLGHGRGARGMDFDVRLDEPQADGGQPDDEQDAARDDPDDDPDPRFDFAGHQAPEIRAAGPNNPPPSASSPPSASYLPSPPQAAPAPRLRPDPAADASRFAPAVSPCCSARRAISRFARPITQPAAPGVIAACRSAIASSRRLSMTRAAPRL